MYADGRLTFWRDLDRCNTFRAAQDLIAFLTYQNIDVLLPFGEGNAIGLIYRTYFRNLKPEQKLEICYVSSDLDDPD